MNNTHMERDVSCQRSLDTKVHLHFSFFFGGGGVRSIAVAETQYNSFDTWIGNGGQEVFHWYVNCKYTT